MFKGEGSKFIPQENLPEDDRGDTTNNTKAKGRRHGMGRIDFIKSLATLAGMTIIDIEYAFSDHNSSEKLTKMTPVCEMDGREPFPDKWRKAIELGLEKFKNNSEIQKKLSQEEINTLCEIVNNFDVSEYIDWLSENYEIEEGEINGEILNFDIEIKDEDDPHGEVKDFRNFKLYISEWLKYKNKFHQPTIHQVMRHELNHLFSFDYSDPDEITRIPWIYKKKYSDYLNQIRVPYYFYEGATELIARLPDEGAESENQSLEPGYISGSTLSAYVVSELVGRKNFVNSYFLKSPELLSKLLNDKFGTATSSRIMSEVIRGVDYSGRLGVLHNIFANKKAYNINNLDEILGDASKLGIKEKVDYFEAENTKMTSCLFAVNDADQEISYKYTLIGKGPRVDRFDDRYTLGEGFGFILETNKYDKEEQEKMIDIGALLLKRRCELQPDEFMIREAYTVIGMDDKIESFLEKLKKVEFNSSEFNKIFQELNTYARQKVIKLIGEVYKKAGVENRISEFQN